MKILCYGGPFDGQEFTVSRYLPVWQITYPWHGMAAAETVEYYRQYNRNIYEWIGSKPYYPFKRK